MLQGITIAGLLDSLQNLGILILKLILLYLVMRISTGLFVWFVRTVIIPIFEKRSYFFSYQSEGVFYNERKFLGIFRFGRNFRSRIVDSLVGYVATKRGKKNENEGSNRIYLRRRGRELVGEAKYKYKDGIDDNGKDKFEFYRNNKGEKVCKIFLTRPDEEGGYEFDENNAVGYVDKEGRVYKYYMDREAWRENRPLDEPLFIGQCETPQATRGERPDTNGERPDADVLKYIKWKVNDSNMFKEGGNEEEGENENGASNEGENDGDEAYYISERRTYKNIEGEDTMDDGWLFFRRNRPLFRKVKAKGMTGGGCVSDGKRFPYAFLSSKLWRFLNVYPCDWDCKAQAWGYGYCTEDFRNPFTQTSEEFPMIIRAGAALLLAQHEGFYLDPDEVVSDGHPGPVATALLSLLVYILLYPLVVMVSKYDLFPFLGTMLGHVVNMIGCFFILWLGIIHPIRCLVRHNHDGFEAFLTLLNRNVGVLGWMSTIVVSLVIGIIGSIFLFGFDYVLFPVFFSALTAVLVNWAYYHQYPWAIASIYDEYQDNDTSDDSQSDEKDPNETETIFHNVHIGFPTKKVVFKEEVKFNPEKLKDLRMKNKFRSSLTSSYEKEVQEMIYNEFYDTAYYSKILFLKSRINTAANKYHLTSAEKLQLIMRVCQPENVKYKLDELCPELYQGFDDNNKTLQNPPVKGFIEYCRFPTETIHDKRGDCDCHAAFCAALMAACGFKACFCVDKNHAMCGVECTDELKAYKRTDNTIEKDGISFILLETAGKAAFDEVLDTHREMVLDNESIIIEPYKKS
jgi:hypothetical protein